MVYRLTISGKAKSVTQKVITLWLENTLPTILSRYLMSLVCALEWVDLIFFPPNTTSITQPMDQEVIWSLKGKYCSLAVKKKVHPLEKRNQWPQFSILTTMSMLTKAWVSISDGTFTNCFKNSEISEKSMKMKTLNDEDNPFCYFGCWRAFDGEFERWSWNDE